jgi:hypothetical protein
MEPSRGAAVERRLRERPGALGVPQGTIKATVLIETILAAFEMDEILYELRDHSRPQLRPLGLHLQLHQEVPRSRRLPDAGPRAGDHDHALHARLLPRSASRPATSAVPSRWAAWRRRSRSRTIPKPTSAAMAKVHADKEARSRRRPRRHLGGPPGAGADRQWKSSTRLGDKPNQIARQREDVHVTAADLLASSTRSARSPATRPCSRFGRPEGDLSVRLAGGGRRQHRGADVSRPVALSGQQRAGAWSSASTAPCSAPTRSRRGRQGACRSTDRPGSRRSSPTPKPASAARSTPSN